MYYFVKNFCKIFVGFFVVLYFFIKSFFSRINLYISGVSQGVTVLQEFTFLNGHIIDCIFRIILFHNFPLNLRIIANIKSSPITIHQKIFKVVIIMLL